MKRAAPATGPPFFCRGSIARLAGARQARRRRVAAVGADALVEGGLTVLAKLGREVGAGAAEAEVAATEAAAAVSSVSLTSDTVAAENPYTVS